MTWPVLMSGGVGAVDAGGRVHVVAVDDERPAAVLDRGHGAQRNHLAVVVADLQPTDVLGLHAVGSIGLHVHLPGAAELVEIVDVQPAQLDLQGVEDIA